jgi:hypothetical protein
MRLSRETHSTAPRSATAVLVPLHLTAQQIRYKLIDLGTLGGPNSTPAGFSCAGVQLINNEGTAIATADTSILDPDYPNFNPIFQPGAYPYVFRPIKWQNGKVIELDSLGAETNSAVAGWITANGIVAGVSETGEVDPLTGWPAAHATVWRSKQPTDLGTLGGYESD